MACVSCGVADPTHIFEFNEEFGLLYVRLIKTRELELCRRCVGRYFLSAFLNNLFLGWWGLISFFKTPINLIQNIAEYWRCRDLEMPDAQALAMAAGAGRIHRPPEYTRVWAKVLPVAAIAIALIVYAAHRLPAPPDTSADVGPDGVARQLPAQIDAAEIEADVAALDDEITAKSWSGIQTELLVERDPYFKRLMNENARVQHVADNLSRSPAETQDACDQWVLKEFAPALKDYMGATTDLVTFVKSTPKAGPNERAQFASLAAKKEAASDAFKTVMVHVASCSTPSSAS